MNLYRGTIRVQPAERNRIGLMVGLAEIWTGLEAVRVSCRQVHRGTRKIPALRLFARGTADYIHHPPIIPSTPHFPSREHNGCLHNSCSSYITVLPRR